MSDQDGLNGFLPVVAAWFRETFGSPTPPQRLGWPAIAAGQSTLLFAPTGSGKTLAAFLACLDHLWRTPRLAPGARILYVSPLKALNQDVFHNLQMPLEGILETARRLGVELPALTVATRSGDTTPADRQKLVRKPPDILITTPESLHLMLTSRARDTLRSISHVIVDEIHALCPNKRGVFLALLLERLEALNPAGFVRVGLSATQRPLDEVARYLGGCRVRSGRGGKTTLEPRPVTIIDTGRRKELDLQVLVPFEQAGPTAPGTTWPAIERKLREMIQAHRSTIVFANNRRVVERLTSRLNELGEDDGGDDATPQVRSHHGSLSLEERRTTETALKQGELQAVVATASLELGIDMGAVDLVCQVESPGSVARGLQRVGRAGHIVGRVSKGRLIAKTTGDLLESAALCRAMLEGEVEALRIPRGCLDVLAQQVVACVAMDRWDVPDLFNLVRGAYPYAQLAPAAFDSVLRMISGRFPTETFRDLRARVSWDRVHNRLHPLPGTARLAVTSGGTIPDTGQYPVYLGEEGPRLGELDEEFVLERRVGETFVLGTAAWRIEAIEAHRVVVARAEGEAAMMPFWRGEDASRTAELGEAVGALSRELRERLDAPDLAGWLHAHYHLDPTAAETLQRHMARQVRLAGAAPDDRTILIEAFRDPAGELGLAVLTPLGGKLHQALKLALQGRLKERLGISVACLHSDDGILIRLPQTDEPPLNLFEGLTADCAEALIRAELGESALFGLRFRQNAGRALLMPRPDPSKRTPLWLQRLRAKDLLQVVRQFPDFPIVVETYRECLDDDLDLPRLRRLLDQIADGSIQVATHHGEIASPFASDLIFRFTSQFLYQWDEPKRVDRLEGRSAVDDGLLDQLLDPTTHAHWLEPNAVGQVESRLREVGQPPRTSDEMAETLRRLGDLAPSELSGPMLKFLVELQEQGRAVEIELPATAEPSRWISAEAEPDYVAAFTDQDEDESESESGGGKRAQETIVRRFLSTHALVGLDELLARYPLGPGRATELLEDWEEQGRLIRIEPADGAGEPRWAERRNLEEVRRLSIALRRRESVAVTPEVFADFVARRQHVHPATRWEGPAAFSQLLEQLIGYAAPAELWESEIWPRRLRDYRPAWLDQALSGGGWSWRAEGEATKGEPRAAFAPRNFPGVWPTAGEPLELSDAETRVLAELERRGASFVDDLARTLALEPSRTRLALERLVRLGLVANDRFDPLRPGGSAMTEALARAAAAAGSNRQRRSLGAGRASLRRTASHRPEGRWERLASSIAATVGDGDGEASCLAWAGALLERYGVLARETVAADPWAPPWRELAPWLARAELRGEIRRGYFVEGLSGVQYAAGDTAEELARLAAAAPQPTRDVLLLSTLDPANLYGSGAPLDVNLLDGGTARLPRSAANFLVLLAGRPILIIEAHGKRLTGLASASEAELRSALALVSTLAGPSRRVLKVDTYNAVPALQSAAAPWLAELGFVRDYPGMAYYAGW